MLGLKPWDITAGALLVQEAGGVITDWRGGQTWLMIGCLVTGTRGVQRSCWESFRGSPLGSPSASSGGR